jgi:hypothetical protein
MRGFCWEVVLQKVLNVAMKFEEIEKSSMFRKIEISQD